MFGRIFLILTLSTSLTACAQSPMLPAADFGSTALQAVPSISNSQIQNLGHKTMAGKVLTAIALERVTGLKPDPARFSEPD